jgi:hypothetical protein
VNFSGPVRVPDGAGPGTARVTVSFPDWPQSDVPPATLNVPVVGP